MSAAPTFLDEEIDDEADEVEPVTFARWEDAAFAAGRSIAVVTGTREELLAGGGEVRVVRDEAGLEPLRVDRLTRTDFATAAKIMASYPSRRAA